MKKVLLSLVFNLDPQPKEDQGAYFVSLQIGLFDFN